jgi:hypothetical protein
VSVVSLRRIEIIILPSVYMQDEQQLEKLTAVAASNMSFWGADCSKLQAKSMQHDADSMQAEDSLWTHPLQGSNRGRLHAADSTAEQGHMRCSMHQQSIGGSLSLDEPTEQSAGYSVQQHLRRSLPDGIASDCPLAWQQQQHPPADDLLQPQLSQLASYSAVNSIQQLSITHSFGGSEYVVEQQVLITCGHACMHACSTTAVTLAQLVS